MCDRCTAGFAFFGLAEPQAPMLESYAAALRTGWSPNNICDVSAEVLAAIEFDPAAYLRSLSDIAPAGITVNGTEFPRLPFRTRWMWDGDFCGSISLRFQPGTDALPPHVFGHIGYTVVPWKRNHGYASRALRQMLDEAREVGLSQIEITTEPQNIASRTVIERNDGVRVGTKSHPAFPATGLVDLYVIKL